jgi:hypothetical protein
MRHLPVSLVATLVLGGCFIEEPGNHHLNGSPGDITFLWSFPNSRTCAQTPDAPFVHVSLSGSTLGDQPLQNDGWYNCTNGGTDGMVLLNFEPDTFTFTIDGYDSTQTVRNYTGTGTVTVNGSVERDVVLAPINQTGRLEVYWQFGTDTLEKVCANTGIADATPVSKVAVQIDGATAQVESCTMNDANGKPVQGFAWDVSPGTHQVNLTGIIVRGSTEEYWYGGTQSATVSVSQTTALHVQLYPISAGGRFTPTLKDLKDSTYASCEAAGVDAIHIKLVDWNPLITADYTSPTVADCDLALSQGIFWDYLAADQTFDTAADTWKGTYSVTVEALSKGTVVGSNSIGATLFAGWKDQAVPIELKF